MKKFLLVLAAGCIFAGCHSKLDLDNVDPSAEVNMGLTLPVGSLRLTINDLVGNVDGLYIDNGVLTWKYDTTKAEAYHNVDLAENISTRTDTLEVYKQVFDQLSEKFPDVVLPAMYGLPITVPIPDDINLALDYPLDLPLVGINEIEDQENTERLDSALIEMASFISTISPINFSFKWDWVDSVALDLGPRFKRPAGNRVTIYPKGEGDPDEYGVPMEIIADKFTLDMMKTKLEPHDKPSKYWYNVYNVCSFTIRFKFTLPKGELITLNPGSAIEYTLGAKFLEYSAIWGMFDASDKMSKEEVIDMSDTWKTFDFMKKASIPFAEPKIQTHIVTHVAGALRLRDSYIYTLDEDNNKTSAKFGPSSDTLFHWTSKPGQYLDPWKSAIGDSTKNMDIFFDKTPDGGRIHEMFRKSPQKLGYKFDVYFDETETPQIRITPNTDITVKSTITLPFIFSQGVFIEYPDSNEVSLSQISIDSIQAESSFIDTISATNVKLIMQAKSMIPLRLKLSMRCLDESGNIVMDPLDPSKPFYLFDKDTISINPPTEFTRIPGPENKWIPSKDHPGISNFIASLTKEQLNVFPKIKRIRYSAVLDDKSLDDAYIKGLNNVSLTDESDVVLKIGLAGNIEAVLNFDKENKK